MSSFSLSAEDMPAISNQAALSPWHYSLSRVDLPLLLLYRLSPRHNGTYTVASWQGQEGKAVAGLSTDSQALFLHLHLLDLAARCEENPPQAQAYHSEEAAEKHISSKVTVDCLLRCGVTRVLYASRHIQKKAMPPSLYHYFYTFLPHTSVSSVQLP